MAHSQLRVSLPPDPNTRAPGWTLPAGACDTHAHVFGPPDLFPYSETRRYTPPAAPIEHYINVQKITGLSRVVFCTPTAHGTDNRVILNAIAQLGDSARGIANIDPSYDDRALDALHEQGIRGARFHLMDDRPGSQEFLTEHLPRLQRRDWILDLHVDPQDLVHHETYIRALPTVTIIDHMARVRGADGIDQPAFRLLLDMLKDDRFWVKVCSLNKISAVKDAHVAGSLPYMDMVPFAKAVIEAAPDRVLWGSDWPNSNIFTPGRVPNVGDLLDLFAVIAPDEAMRKRILVDNPARLFGFSLN
jgi:2-pyrone-4,6-dicarboxylate lactonase